jgi:hypothetical protein
MKHRHCNLISSYRHAMAATLLSVMVISLNSCSRPRGNLTQQTMDECNPAAVRQAAIPLLSKYKNTNNLAGFVVPFDQIPMAIKSMPIFSNAPNLIITWWVTTNNDSLAFVNGSGFGHWGVVVCQNENSREFDGWTGYTYWTNGIYFYNGN